MLNTLPSSPKEVARFLPTAYDLRMPVFLWGKPGIGKSDLIRQYAQTHKMDLIDVRLTTLESCDLRGLPRINYETGQTEWMRPEFLPEIDTPVAIFLDELTAAEPRIQALAYQLILDRCIGKHRLPDQAWVVGAGNTPEDGAVSYGMGTALADRFLHLNVVANPEDWMEWAVDHSIASEVITFLRVRPEMLDSCGGQEQTEQLVTPSPRSWARVSRVLEATKDQRVRSIAVNGLLGEAVAVQFFHTLEEIGQLPPIDKLLRLPAKEAARKVPATLPGLYGLTYSLVRYTSKLTQYEQAIELLEAVSQISDVLPRREIQSLGMELLLGKAHRTNQFQALTKSETYQRVYRSKAQELVH
ncbi:MAG TPA: AAA family ATPase [Acidobacteriaceae bacterium]|nr:AAA family ATPase [Acidobacteriaceae bacterium]